MRFEDYPELTSFCETSWPKLVAMARLALNRYSPSEQSGSGAVYRDAEELILETIDKHLQLLNARILDTPRPNILNIFSKLIQHHVRNTVIHDRNHPVEGASWTMSSPTEDINGRLFQIFFQSEPTEDIDDRLFQIFFQSEMYALSLGVRLVTWPEDRWTTVKAKPAFDKLACQMVGLARAREHITCLPGI